MTLPQLKSKIESRPATIALITFVIGFGFNGLVNYIAGQQTLKMLTEQVAKQSAVIDKLSDKLDAKGDHYQEKLDDHEVRIGILEGKPHIKPVNNKIAEN